MAQLVWTLAACVAPHASTPRAGEQAESVALNSVAVDPVPPLAPPAPIAAEPVSRAMLVTPPPLSPELIELHDTPCGAIESQVYWMGFGVDGDSLVVLYDSGEQCVLQVRGRRLVSPRRIRPPRLVERDGWPFHPMGIPFSPDGRWGLTFSADEEPLLQRLGSSRPPTCLRPFGDALVHEVLLSADAALFQNEEGDVVAWSYARRRRLDVSFGMGSPGQMVASEDGRVVALSDGSSVAAWEVETGATVLPRFVRSRVQDIAFTADRRLVAVDAAGGYYSWKLPVTDPEVEVERAELGRVRREGSLWIVPGSGAVLRAIDNEVSIDHVLEPGAAPRSRAFAVPGLKHEFAAPSFTPDGGRVSLSVDQSTWFIDLDALVLAGMTGRYECDRSEWALRNDGLAVSGSLCVLWL
ncbi:hypothetical protein [Nannocystis punicea]|uniref:PQQ-like domain-containing protein n=1 Tax=Nannocystis punicea TaxID=2995304 RepID=A0ABY7H222_9BACT|nr:hypothetical protein [Nannocystis poenicansa]WAS93297.1 hypothetical protein O0S08_44700 [Nannocystis poenicansa]